MSKEIKFSSDARSAMVRGVDILADTVKSNLWDQKVVMSCWKNHLAHHSSPMTVLLLPKKLN